LLLNTNAQRGNVDFFELHTYSCALCDKAKIGRLNAPCEQRVNGQGVFLVKKSRRSVREREAADLERRALSLLSSTVQL